MIHEKSTFLIKKQKQNLKSKKVIMDKRYKKVNSYDPTIFLANEFFDAYLLNNFLRKKKVGLKDL